MIRLTIFLFGAAVAAGCGDDAGCGDCVQQGYRLDLSAAAPGIEPPPAALFSGWRNGWCQNDLVCTGGPDVFLDNLDPGVRPWSCDPTDEELIVFAGGHAPSFADVERSAAGSSVTLDDPVSVGVTVWLLSPDMTSKAEEETQLAKDTYTDLGTGIQLEFQIKPFPSPLPAELGDLWDKAACILAPSLGELSSGNDPKRLNVYYVAGFNLTAEGPVSGVDCANPPAFREDIILVNGKTSPVTTLAHELGHALGLRRSAPLPGGSTALYGDVNELHLDRYLAPDNLMKSGSGDYVGQVTLGQVYRMHFDKLSWLRTFGSPRAGYPRECQNSAVEGGPCPPLTLHPPRGWE